MNRRKQPGHLIKMKLPTDYVTSNEKEVLKCEIQCVYLIATSSKVALLHREPAHGMVYCDSCRAQDCVWM